MHCMKTAICKECEQKLWSYGQPCLDACLLACLGMSEGKFPKYNPDKDEKIAVPISFLEKKLYLISSEVSQNEIAFMPTCEPYLIDLDTLAYCWCE